MKKNIFIWVTTALLVILFTYTGLSKLADHHKFVRMLGLSPYVYANPHMLAWLLPAGELMTAAMLITPQTRFYGLYSSFVLLVVFTAYIAFMLAFAPHLSCTCGGVLQNMSWKAHLYLNTAFMVLALTALVLQKKQLLKNKAQKVLQTTGDRRIPV